MIKNSQNQIGSAHVVIFVVLVAFIIGALGLVVWNNFINKEESQSSFTSSNGKSDSFTSPTQESDEKTYKNETIGISFTYPKQWVNLNCKDNPNIVFFASDSRGIGGDNDSLLCGGGSDFPPQMSFYIANGSVEIANDASSLIIDGLEAQKSVFVSSNESIRPEGFEITKYSVPLADGRAVVFTYSKWPKESTSSYDTSDETKQRFQDLVESSLTFI
ncbi:MAG: hypothetical protein JWN28_99 [Candidatus Saccharibacteria bacterium]|nr:hypothetical protein [Candidatus Saccharibacteria bacterium]